MRRLSSFTSYSLRFEGSGDGGNGTRKGARSMNNNRALEFLYTAKASFPLLHDRWGWKAKQFVDLAITEVQELLDRIAELEEQRSVEN